MQSPCGREASKACFLGCCGTPFLGLPELQNPTTEIISGATAPRYDFIAATASSLHPHAQFTNHESLPSLLESFSSFNKAYPKYSQTSQADQIRAREYYHLCLSHRVCLDYIGHGVFSYSQQERHQFTPPTASSSSSPPPAPNSNVSHVPFFDILHKSVNLSSQIIYGGGESEFESRIRKRIMGFMNISEDDYSMVFTANKSSAFKLIAENYPFHANRNLLTVYDHESEAVEALIENSMKRGTQVRSAEFSWPSLRIQSRKLRNIVVGKRKKSERGLFVFPLQSRMTGTRYSYLWMSMAQENGWHVLLDASALGAKDMETLGLSLFQPDFLICSFFKIFGENPSGFGCLFIKKSSASLFNNSSTATSMGIVSLVPAPRLSQSPQDSASLTDQDPAYGPRSFSTFSDEYFEIQESKELGRKQKEPSFSEIVEEDGSSELECRGLDHADSIGLVLISSRARYLVNWLVNALMSLQHPHSEIGLPLVKIYGPKIRLGRGPAVAFNVLDWKGEKIDPTLVQKLADRNNISLSIGFLHHIWFPDSYEEERERVLETRTNEGTRTTGNKRSEKSHSGIHVVAASLGFLINFEDMYRLWAFVSRFLDADFVEKEQWRYMALNQSTIEV